MTQAEKDMVDEQQGRAGELDSGVARPYAERPEERLHPQSCRVGILLIIAGCVLMALALLYPANAEARPQAPETAPACAPSGSDVGFLGFSDALDKETFEGTEVGGLSALAYDRKRGVYYSLVDNGPESDSPVRFYTLRAPVYDL